MNTTQLECFMSVSNFLNFSRAAEQLCITQPAVSHQINALEDELGVKLFHRSRYRIVLTDDGMLLRQRAQEIVALAEKTEREFMREEGILSGEISIGCGETRNMTFLSRRMVTFRQVHPMVQFSIYSANADDIKDRLEKGILDLGLLAEPVDIGRYEFIRMPSREQWGVLVRKDSPLAERDHVTPPDLLGIPLLLSGRESVGCVTWSRAAALVMFSSRATVRKYLRTRSSIVRHLAF